MNSNPVFHNTLPSRRNVIFALVVSVVFGFYILRLFTMQILQGADWAAQAERNRITEINLPAPRGIIYDRHDVILAQNIPSYNVNIVWAELPDDPGEVQEIVRQLSALTGVPINLGTISDANPFVPCKSEHGINQVLKYGEESTPFQPVPVKCNIDRETALVIEQRAVDWPGVYIEVVSQREYPTGSLTANVVGYLGPIGPQNEEYYTKLGFLSNRDKVGYAGVEAWFQDELAGHNGLRTVERDSAGKYYDDIKEPVEAQAGQNLRLTLDWDLQKAAESILIDEIDYWNRIVIPDKIMTSGVVIAMNPTTGEILAMVSYPTYENNRMAREIPSYYYDQLIADPRLPLLNHAVGDQLPVGSVFKLVTITGALNEGVVTPDQMIDAPPQLTVIQKFYANDPGQPRNFVEWNKAGFGQLNPIDAVSWSCNVCFYKMGGGYEDEIPEGLGICRLGSYARALGYGTLPGVELPDTAGGLIPDPRWKNINQGESWSTGDTYIASVGQGFVIGTPLQVLLSAATIANDGKLMEPTILLDKLDGEGNIIQPFQPRMRWDLTQEPLIDVYGEISLRGCEPTGEKKTIQPEVFELVQQGMRGAVTFGTLSNLGFSELNISIAGKTGTAEYCDKYVRVKNLCQYGAWPTHAWTVVYAPFDNPEIAVVAFVYNGGEGSSVAGPIVRRVLKAYFEIKAIDNAYGRQ